jgi:alpha-ribazole phosphatase/probable phosphoglycerate mutase
LLGERRRNDGLDIVFTSDLRRAVETAGIAFGGAPLRIVADERLRECDYGELNGTPEPVHDRAAHIDVRYPGGESWRQAVERVAGFLDELRRERAGERVLVIGHSATWLALELVANGRALEEVIAEPFVWQPGWEYRLYRHVSVTDTGTCLVWSPPSRRGAWLSGNLSNPGLSW